MDSCGFDSCFAMVVYGNGAICNPAIKVVLEDDISEDLFEAILDWLSSREKLKNGPKRDILNIADKIKHITRGWT